MRSTVHYIIPEGTDRLPEPDYSSLLPDYESAVCASIMKQAPPPSYQAAMEGQQPPTYPEAVHVVTVTPTTCYGVVVTENRESASADNIEEGMYQVLAYQKRWILNKRIYILLVFTYIGRTFFNRRINRYFLQLNI